MKHKIKHNQATNLYLIDTLATSHAATSNGNENASYKFFEKVLTERTSKDTLDDTFIGNFRKWSQSHDLIALSCKMFSI